MSFAEVSRRSFVKGGLAAVLSGGSLVPVALASAVVDESENQTAESGTRTVLQDDFLAITIRQGQDRSFSLVSLLNKARGVEYLRGDAPLFEIARATPWETNPGKSTLVADRIGVEESGKRLRIEGRLVEFPITFRFLLDGSFHPGSVRGTLTLTNGGKDSFPARAAIPRLTNLSSGLPEKPYRCVLPQEAGGLASYGRHPVNLGMVANPTIGLPTAFNIMEVLSIFDEDSGEGMYLCDVDGDLEQGVAPLQFTVIEDVASGLWIGNVEPGQEVICPAFELGVFNSGGWRSAIDRYVELQRPRWSFPHIPSWFREQGAIYAFAGSGGGSIYMDFPAASLRDRINSFTDLPKLLTEAKEFGTNIVYLWDYWEAAPEGNYPAYWNKGDYIPRRDLGGEQGLHEGIRRVHDAGGRIILYLEPFVIFYYSEIGKRSGTIWADRKGDGKPYSDWGLNFEMVPCFVPWQDYLTNLAKRIVGEWDADGIYLDSLGWEMNWPSLVGQSHTYFSPMEYSRGFLDLTDKVVRAVQSIKQDAIVMGESTSGPLPRHSHGGLSADFAWLRNQNQGRLLASPVRYGIPETNIFSNGHNRNELHQVYAAGHNLALTYLERADAPYIRQLVLCRQRYKDSLIYGRQVCQPKASSPDVIAYLYEGKKSTALTIANIGEGVYIGKMDLRLATYQNSMWCDAFTGETVVASNGQLAINVEGQGLRLLVRE